MAAWSLFILEWKLRTCYENRTPFLAIRAKKFKKSASNYVNKLSFRHFDNRPHFKKNFNFDIHLFDSLNSFCESKIGKNPFDMD